MNEKELNFKYNAKAEDSFITKLNLFLFWKATSNSELTNPFSLDEFDSFQINNKIILEYTSAWQIRYSDVGGEKIKKLDTIINDWHIHNSDFIKQIKEHYVYTIFPKTIFPKKDFEELLKANECYYCHITIDKINELIRLHKLYKKHITRGWTLEIDRKYPNKEYTFENSVMCCYWCNNAKTDEFCYNEFIEVGKVFSKIWQQRLTKEK